MVNYLNILDLWDIVQYGYIPHYDPSNLIMIQGAKNMKTGPNTFVTAEYGSGRANMKTGPDDLGTTHNGFGSEKHKNWT
jgi:hypothetical protein